MTKLLTQTFEPFPDSFKCSELITRAEAIDPYEKPTDKLGTHYEKFSITQKQLILGTTTRYVYVDFYRKRISIRSSFEGIIFESRGNLLIDYKTDAEDHFLVRLTFGNDITPIEFWMESTEEINKLFEVLTDFKEVCKGIKDTGSK